MPLGRPHGATVSPPESVTVNTEWIHAAPHARPARVCVVRIGTEMNGMQPFRQTLAAGLVAGLAFGAGSAQAALMLDDFESGVAGINGTLTGTGAALPPGSPLPPSANETGLGLGIAPAGTGVCDHLTGSSSALCGADTLQWAGQGGAQLSYDVDFTAFSAVLFDLAAFSDDDPFDHYDDERPALWGDFFRVSALVDGITTLLAEFTGIRTAERETSDNEFTLVSTDGGTALGAGVVAGKAFNTVQLGIKGQFGGAGQLVFDIRSSGSAEQIGLDEIRLATSPVPVPLPGALALALMGLGYLGAVRRLRRA